tara:strand:- start:1053 stop:1433 length:381 start_codon:yes stop_codon:yes gene_type:complete
MNFFNIKSKNVKTKETKKIDNKNFIDEKVEHTLDISEQWCCPICLDNLSEVTDFAYPFNCTHLTCYNCFCNQVNYYINNNLDPFSLECCLCCKDVKKIWKTTSILKGETYLINGNSVRIYSPKTLS